MVRSAKPECGVSMQRRSAVERLDATAGSDPTVASSCPMKSAVPRGLPVNVQLCNSLTDSNSSGAAKRDCQLLELPRSCQKPMSKISLSS